MVKEVEVNHINLFQGLESIAKFEKSLQINVNSEDKDKEIPKENFLKENYKKCFYKKIKSYLLNLINKINNFNSLPKLSEQLTSKEYYNNENNLFKYPNLSSDFVLFTFKTLEENFIKLLGNKPKTKWQNPAIKDHRNFVNKFDKVSKKFEQAPNDVVEFLNDKNKFEIKFSNDMRGECYYDIGKSIKYPCPYLSRKIDRINFANACNEIGLNVVNLNADRKSVV